MTINEACIKVLTELGGKAPLKVICPKVQELIVFKGATPYNSICTELINHPKNFRRSEGQKGWWELISYQEEISIRDQQIKELESKLSEKCEEIEELKRRPTVDEFVRRLVNATKKIFGITRKHADYIRQVLLKLGRDEEQEELLLWIQHKEKKPLKKEAKIIQNISNSQIFNGQVKESEFNSGGSNHAG